MIPLGEDGYCTHFTGEEYAIILSGPGTWAMAKQDSHARARKCAANLLSCHVSSKVQIPWWSTWVHKIVTHPGKCVSHGTIYPSTSDAHCLAPLCGCGYLLHREEEITAVSGNPCAAKGKNKPVHPRVLLFPTHLLLPQTQLAHPASPPPPHAYPAVGSWSKVHFLWNNSQMASLPQSLPPRASLCTRLKNHYFQGVAGKFF
jgi:hypothetical protein